MLVAYLFINKIQYNTDEGFNVMKAMLNCNGYSLYKDIWSDQPPLFTHALSILFHIFGFEVNVARFFVLLLSCMLLWGAWHFLWQIGGYSYAFTGVVLIALLPYYTKLSISVMIGLPSLSLAVVSLSALATWHRKEKNIWLICSAVSLSFSIFTKAFTGCLFPAFLISFIIIEFLNKTKKGYNERLWPVILWLLIFIIASLIILFLFVGLDNMSQLWGTHIEAKKIADYDKYTLNIGQNVSHWLLLLALMGILLMVRKRKWIILYLVLWIGIVYFVLNNHTPIWYHQRLLITIPIAILAACTIGEVIKWIPGIFRSKKVLNTQGLIIILVTVLTIFVLKDQMSSIIKQTKILSRKASTTDTTTADYQILLKMKGYASKTKLVITDYPIYAFRAGLPVPPYLAVISAKRLATKMLTKDDIFKFIRELQPEQILLARFYYPAYMVKYLKRNYRLIHSSPRKKLFVSNDILTGGTNTTFKGFDNIATGGFGGKKITVSNLADLKKYAVSNSPYIIYVSGKISGDDAVIINSNKSIIGIDSTSHLKGIGLKINDGVNNVIVQNMVFSKVKATNDKDAIQINNGANHIWIDHCELFSDRKHGKDFYDGLIDITCGSYYVTISWCIFHDHYKAILIGDSDSATSDRGKLKVTLHHNYFYNIGSRTPSLRFGAAHVYNNYFKNIHKAISSRMDACIRVEQNYFENVKHPIITDESPISGNIQLLNNEISYPETNKIFPTCNYLPPYKYENVMHKTSDVPVIVIANAGAIMNVQE